MTIAMTIAMTMCHHHQITSTNRHYQFDISPTRHGKINFVDLAGSEMTKKTKSEGKTLEEANNINKSLMVTFEELTIVMKIIT